VLASVPVPTSCTFDGGKAKPRQLLGRYAREARSGGGGGLADDQPGQEDVHDRPDGENDEHRPGVEVATQNSAQPGKQLKEPPRHPATMEVKRAWGATVPDSRMRSEG